MAWFIYEMSRNPDCYDKLFKEVSEVLSDGEPTQNNMGRLKFLEQSWKETLRLYPAAPGGNLIYLCS